MNGPTEQDRSTLSNESIPNATGQRSELSQPPLKVCRKCSVQTATTGEFCPHCGAGFSTQGLRSKLGALMRSRPARRIAIAVGLLAVIGAITAGLAWKVHQDNVEMVQRAEAEQAKEREEAAQAAERDTLAAKRKAEEDERSDRRTIVTALEASVLKDAREKVKSLDLDGPILSTTCTPVGGGSVDDLTALTGVFQCIAVNKNLPDGTSEGYRFTATVNWDDASYSWHLGS